MQKLLTLVLTRKVWVAGKVEDNFRNIKVFTDRVSAIKALNEKADELFEPLGIRDGNNWIYQA